MTRTSAPLLAAAALAAAASLPAQDHLITMGFADNQGPLVSGNSFPIARGKDADRNGVVDPGEIHTFMTRVFGTRSFNTDIRSVIEDGEFAFYISDSDNGAIMRAQDSDHDGVLDDPEVNLFFDFGPRSPGQSGFSPDGIAAYVDPATGQTRVYVAKETDNTNGMGQTFSRGLWRLVDLNGDGDAMDMGEAAPFVTTAMNLQVNDVNGAPVTINADFFEHVRVTAHGKVIAWRDGPSIAQDPVTGLFPPMPGVFVYYGFVDNNGTAVPEVFFNFSALNTFAQFPDFANGTFPNWDVTSPSATGTVARNFAEFFDSSPGAGPNGENVYFFGSSYSTNRSHVNLNGQSVAGLVYRWIDTDNDDTVDVGEFDLFGNLSGTPVNNRSGQPVPAVSYQDRAANNNPVSTLDFSVFGFTGNDNSAQIWHDLNDCIITMRDTNGNGMIDQGEAIQTYFTPQPYTTPFSPMFGPFVESIFAFDVGEMPGPFPAGAVPFGDGCIAPTRGLRPVMETWNGGPIAGNSGFEIGMIRGVPGVLGLPGPLVFLLGSFSSNPTGFDLTGFGLPGCTGWLNNPTTLGFVNTDSKGRAIFALGIPASPGLVGTVAHFQCAMLDPAGLGTPGLPFFTSNGLSITVQ